VKETHPFLTEKYGRFATHLIATLNTSTVVTPQMAWDVQITHLLYKCLAKNIVWLWTHPKNTQPEDTEQVNWTVTWRISYLSEPEYTPDLNFLFKLCPPVPNLV
jgi:hypothetical protein